MNKFDLTPWHRSTVGFDRVFDALDKHFAHATSNSYPPYNILKLGENSYVIELAVAGFRENDIEVIIKENELTISGKIEKSSEEDLMQYLHKGISTRGFTRVFTLGDYVEVKSAVIENGLLVITLERVIPEENLPRKIPVTYTK